MAVTTDGPAPYTSTAAMTGILARNRTTGLPSPITKDVLLRAGVSESLAPRTLQALTVLDLIDEEGRHTETLKALRSAPEAEYNQRMVEWLNAAYADVLQFADPASGDETAVRDAFRNNTPQSMLHRMVTLFTGLYGEAGVWPQDAQRARTETLSRKPAPKAKTARRTKTGSTASTGANGNRSDRAKQADYQTPPPPERQEKALEYRLVDLIPEAVGEPEVMEAIIKIVTFLKTKEAPQSDDT